MHEQQESFDAALVSLNDEDIWNGLAVQLDKESLVPYKNFAAKYSQTSEGTNSELSHKVAEMVRVKEALLDIGENLDRIQVKHSSISPLVRGLRTILETSLEENLSSGSFKDVQHFVDTMDKRYNFNGIVSSMPLLEQLILAQEPVSDAEETLSKLQETLQRLQTGSLGKEITDLAREMHSDYPQMTWDKLQYEYEGQQEEREKTERYDNEAKEILIARTSEEIRVQTEVVQELQRKSGPALEQAKTLVQSALAQPLENILTDLPNLVSDGDVKKMTEAITELQRLIH